MALDSTGRWGLGRTCLFDDVRQAQTGAASKQRTEVTTLRKPVDNTRPLARSRARLAKASLLPPVPESRAQLCHVGRRQDTAVGAADSAQTHRGARRPQRASHRSCSGGGGHQPPCL